MKSSSLLTSVARGVIWSVVIPLFLLYAFSVRAQTYIFGRADFPVGTVLSRSPQAISTGTGFSTWRS